MPGQFFSKKKAVAGKVLSAVLALLLLFGAYYLFRAGGALNEITGGEYKLDNIVVAVMADNKAEDIQDAKELYLWMYNIR